MLLFAGGILATLALVMGKPRRAPAAADGPSRFDLDVTVTHVIINRFLPFDQRVLIRVYASPTDGRSGGGYVQYTLAGTFVKVIR